MGIAEKRRNRVREFVAPDLEAGERVDAQVPHVQTGPSPWFALLTYLIFFWIRVYAIVVTDRRVMFIRNSISTNKPKSLESAQSRADVQVLEWTPRSVWSKLVLDERGDGVPLSLNVHRLHRDDAEQLVAALGGVRATPEVQWSAD